nr:hypothetical protein Cduv_447 [Cedratvirus duvanny]
MDDTDKIKVHAQCSVEVGLLDKHCNLFHSKYNKESCQKSVDAFAMCIEYQKTLYEHFRKDR